MATTILAPLVWVGGVTLALALSAGTAMAQPGTPPRRTAPPTHPAATAATTDALPRDLVAVYQPAQSFIESYSAENPCVYHTHTHKAYVKLRRTSVTPLPSGTKATFFKDGQVLATWDVVTQTGSNSEPIVLGSFTWTTNHDCSGGVSTGPPTYGYRLVIDPGNQVAEASELNNSVEFRINQIAAFVKIP